MFIAIYTAVMVIGAAGAAALALVAGLGAWQSAAIAAGVLVTGQIAILSYVALTLKRSASRTDTPRAERTSTRSE